MAKKANVKIKIKGSVAQVSKAISTLAGKTEHPLREADFRARKQRENV